MCKETRQVYSNCYCHTVLHEICALHKHTRMQIDNDPCPGLIRLTTESARGCRSRNECKVKVDKFYTFENNGAGLFKKGRNKSRERKERQEREKREKEERERKLAERQEADMLYRESRKKRKMKKEKMEAQEVELNQIQIWDGGIRGGEQEVREADQEMDV